MTHRLFLFLFIFLSNCTDNGHRVIVELFIIIIIIINGNNNNNNKMVVLYFFCILTTPRCRVLKVATKNYSA